MHSENNEDTSLGYIYIQNGSLNITAADDGIIDINSKDDGINITTLSSYDVVIEINGEAITEITSSETGGKIHNN